MNKKADVTEIILILIMLFFLAVSFIVVIFVNDKFKDIVETTVLNESGAASTIASALNTINTKTVQRGFVLIFAVLIIGIMVSSFLIRIHPIWLFMYIFFLGFGIFLAVFLGNTYQKIIEVDALSSIATQQTMITWIMQHIVLIMVAIGALSMIIIFSKIFREGGYVQTRL